MGPNFAALSSFLSHFLRDQAVFSEQTPQGRDWGAGCFAELAEEVKRA